ncbi:MULTISPECIES: serine hydrolase domain-containing protein [Chryseobacterium]|uniref:CubicO group peptidase (Beta-lactamase class C family) n=1 Tax=Chryseobacterium camelliae TaxID=1265445 RepID=A0ABU0TGP1_9FLAO|nr:MULTISPECIES: serine hydrolase [Chryseobacterium]MDT3405977.1 CubicO group peptidase (beta-lactamase class C family) [Pseudacidovorax intermedius]MDQ1096220.1 CubicO group peptidase (beta-lactamase class C family) [Chryseobacterium camelliae]MDQ1100157.1 CubicO group peptidase (beta-lactamase class C family) [Chryseobacterium sp. SORGH_AS_1048]MDR6087500.1 CubicO group peptidase (beta-lactamase class C family) [Chryseobacterium sp. SORGH_AS_0909]MDR6131874.1 CubicO group peptidase (beta-lac
MRRIFSLVLIITISNISFGQKTQSQRIDSVFTSLYQKKMFNGNVLIAEKGKIIFEKNYGLANEETKQKLDNNTIFELASISKQFTAMGIVLLEKQGKLKYDDNISKYIPELSFYRNITIRNLLNHTSGLPDYIKLFEEHWDKTKIATNQDIVNLFVQYQPKLYFNQAKNMSTVTQAILY